MRFLFLFISTALLLTFSSCQSSNDSENTPVENNSLPDSSATEAAEIEERSDDPSTTTPQFQPTHKGADYQEFYEDGQLKIEGNYDANNQRHGIWVSYYDNGQKWSESVYQNGLKNGHSITFFPNGNVRYVGDYKEDKKTGVWTFYDESGEVTQEKTY